MYSKNKFAGKKPDNRKPDVKPQVKLWECQVCEKKHQRPFCCKDCKKPHHPPCSPFKGKPPKKMSGLKVVGAMKNETDDRLEITIDNHVVECIPDTGAQATIMSKRDFEKSGLAKRVKLSRKNPWSIVTMNGSPLKQDGHFMAKFEVDGFMAEDRVNVCRDVDETYLSNGLCKDLSILHLEYPRPRKFGIQPKLGGAVVRPELSEPVLGEVDPQGSAWPPPEVWAEEDREVWLKSLPENPTEEEMDVIREKIKTVYAPVFVSDGKRMRGPIVGDPMKITLKEDAVPFAIHSARKVPLAKQPKFKEEIHKMAENSQICLQRGINGIHIHWRLIHIQM